MFEWIVSSSVLIVVVILLRFILRGKISLRLQYALWALVLVRLLVPVSLGTSAMSVENLARRAAETEPALIVSALSELELPKMSYRAAYDEVAREYAERGIQIEDIPFEQYAETVVYEIEHKMRGALSIAEVVRVIWLSGSALVGLWFLISNLRFSHCLKRSRSPLACECGLPVYLSDTVDAPCLFGLFRPAIYLTGEAAGDEQTLRHALAHELSHYRHRDHIWAILRCVCLAVHWYNPLVWWAARLSGNDAELACDESTLLRLGEPERAAYGRTLLRLTCERRPALLNTATTMTGSGRSIRERIALLVQKPRTALCTAIALAVIAAAAVGCTFTGAEETDTPWSWAQGLDAGDVTGAVCWRIDGTETTLTEEETSELLRLLNALEKDDFTENSQLSGATPTFGLTIETPEDKYYITESVAPAGALEINYGNSQWWIDSEALAGFVIVLSAREIVQAFVPAEGDKFPFVPIGTVEVEVDDSIPQAAFDYAMEYIRRQINYYNELGDDPPQGGGSYTITAARITALEQVSTGTAGLNEGVNLYRLEYRLLPDHPENVILAGGMSMEEGWITEWNSPGQPYLLLHYEDRGDNTIWTPIAVIHTDTIEFGYGTPELLEKYGNAYTAAAMELYAEYQANQMQTAPAEALFELFDAADAMMVTLYLANEGACRAYTVSSRWYAERFGALIDCYRWKELEMPGTAPSEYWLTVESPDGTHKMTFWSGGAGMIQYKDGDRTRFWNAEPLYEGQSSIALDIRREYDNLDVDFSRIMFYTEGDAEAAARVFVHSAYGSHMMSLTPGNWHGITEYEVIDWSVREISGDGTTLVGEFRYAFVPEDPDSPAIWAGNTENGTGEYEGMLTAGREFILQRQDDGYWHCKGFGTGGYTLPE